MGSGHDKERGQSADQRGHQPAHVVIQSVHRGSDQVADHGAYGSDHHQTHGSGDQNRNQWLCKEFHSLRRDLVRYGLHIGTTSLPITT